LIESPHPVQTPAAALARALRNSALSLVLVAGLAGCRHKTPVVLPQGATAPVDLEATPESANPAMIATEPAPVPPPLQPVQPPKPVARKKPAPAPKEAPPVQVASAEPATLAIGSLSAGGESSPQSQQEAKDLIAAIKKRLAALPSKTANQQKDEVRQVNNFVKQAQQALDSGDADGAKNLATKAKLLMDDIEKK
jgi:hypothetical protein